MIENQAATEKVATEAAAAAHPTARRRETRARLIEAAAQVFVEEGLQGASVESICARAGFTRGAFYSNFSSKEELFLAALDEQHQRRMQHLTSRAAEMVPLLRDCERSLQPEEVAKYAAELMTPADEDTVWFALETEFLLLAMRDPSLAPEFADFLERFDTGLTDVVEELVSATGRRFVLPVERAMPVFVGIYERALRVSALSGADAPYGLNEFGDRIGELLFAITEEIR